MPIASPASIYDALRYRRAMRDDSDNDAPAVDPDVPPETRQF